MPGSLILCRRARDTRQPQEASTTGIDQASGIIWCWWNLVTPSVLQPGCVVWSRPVTIAPVEHELRERPQPPPVGAAAPIGPTLAVDAGQTATRASVVDGGVTGPTGHGPGVRHLQSPGGVEHAAAAIHAAARQAGLPGSVGVVCLGLSGFADAMADLERLAAELARRLGAARVVIASDVVTSYLGALGLRPGVVLAAGTGSVALAADGGGARRVRRRLGPSARRRGQRLRDRPGGPGQRAARGRRARRVRCAAGPRGGRLRAPGRAARGDLRRRGAGAPGGRRSPRRWPTRHAPATTAARAIWATAAGELATTAVAAAERTFGAGVPADVSWAGGLFAAEDLLRAPFARAARRAGAAPARRRAGRDVAGRCAAPGRARGEPDLPRTHLGVGGRAPMTLELLRDALIVSCQAPPGSPLRAPAHMAAMAQAAMAGGARGIRAEGAADIEAITRAVELPVIGLRKLTLAGHRRLHHADARERARGRGGGRRGAGGRRDAAPAPRRHAARRVHPPAEPRARRARARRCGHARGGRARARGGRRRRGHDPVGLHRTRRPARGPRPRAGGGPGRAPGLPRHRRRPLRVARAGARRLRRRRVRGRRRHRHHQPRGPDAALGGGNPDRGRAHERAAAASARARRASSSASCSRS